MLWDFPPQKPGKPGLPGFPGKSGFNFSPQMVGKRGLTRVSW